MHIQMLIAAVLALGAAVAGSGMVGPEVVEELRKGLGEIKTGIDENRTGLKKHDKNYDDLTKALEEVRKENEEVKKHLDKLRKQHLGSLQIQNLAAAQAGRERVSDECAKWLSGLAIAGAEQLGKLARNPAREELLRNASEILGIEQRTALGTGDIPMPTNFAAEVVELVFKYGSVRKFMTVYPLGTLTTKLPKLTTSPSFGIIALSATVTEKSPQVAFVTFTAVKSGGLIRIPTEIEADSIVNLGQFLARYIAREMAKWEDTWGFMADGSGTYNSQSGVCKTADTLGNKIQLTATNSSPDKITLANMRNLRAKPDGATLPTAAYYMHPTMEALMVTFNTSATVTPYILKPDGSATLDGFPIRWIPVMPIYDTSAHLNQYQVAFGDLSYWYFGERYGLDVQISRDVFFATDEIAMRALERFDIELMANNAMAVLQLSAS
jgi:HK97 family phage major capsid protein